jgi:Periplasmic copper-binding protein (NosD)
MLLRHTAVGILCIFCACGPKTAAEPLPTRTYNLATYDPPTDGKADATAALAACFRDAAKTGGTVVIPPGDYALAGKAPIALASRLDVIAAGARFHLPEKLGDRARVDCFVGRDLVDFRWTGGAFLGHCFDLRAEANAWEPNVGTRGIVVTTSAGGVTDRLAFRDIASDHLAGAAITVTGALKAGSESEVTTFAENVTVESCNLIDTGKFMWDYGFLWQILLWPEDFTKAERTLAEKYFDHSLIRDSIRMADGDDRVYFGNAKRPVPISRGDGPGDMVCFYGDKLPDNVVRGKGYYVVESHPDHIKIAEKFRGEPIRFAGSAGPAAKMIADLQRAFGGLYAPLGSAPGKGAFDLVGCRGVRVTGCRISALGDAMHIQRSRNVVFANNQILGARMGAFFLAEFCKNAVITGNTVDGTNGSRVVSVEKSCEDVVIVGNTFRGGGRGSWINQPKNLVIAGNIFVNNTTKCEHDPKRGRRTWKTGDYESYAELYVTTYEAGGRYDSVIVRDNIFDVGKEASAALSFAKNGSRIVVTGNILKGPVRTIQVDDGCKDVVVEKNLHAAQK